MIFRILFWRGEANTSVRLFSKRREATCGDLFMLNDEFDELREKLGAHAEFVDKTDRHAMDRPMQKGRRR